MSEPPRAPNPPVQTIASTSASPDAPVGCAIHDILTASMLIPDRTRNHRSQNGAHMRKLKLESLQVESFETVALAPRLRGTVDAHGDPQPTPTTISIETYDPERCGETQYFDCS